MLKIETSDKKAGKIQGVTESEGGRIMEKGENSWARK